MAWQIEFNAKAEKEFGKLDSATQKRIFKYFERIKPNPRLYAENLVGAFSGLHKFRVGDYRLICKLEDEKLIVIVIKIGHRREVYD
jgi:mRNA interferase RelE/StbE